jgi:hypothetical protein
VRRFFASLLLISAVLALPLTARADVVFIDFNNSTDEVRQAQAALDKRNAAERERATQENRTFREEKLHVYPGMAPEWTAALKSNSNENIKASTEKRKACAAGGDANTCQSATSALTNVQNAKKEILAKLPKMDEGAQLSKELAKLKAQGVTLSSLIISGHHTDQEFWGIQGDLDEEELEKAFLDNKPLGDNLKSIYLWGCYAATTDDFLKGWKKAFPSTSMMVGFAGQAPAGTSPSSGRLLGDLMGKESDFQNTRDRDELKRMFDSLTDINKVKAQMCLDRETVISKAGVRSLNDDILACGHRSREEANHIKVFYCYQRCEIGCEDVPKDTDNRSPLRTAYDYFQETRHCDEALEAQGQKREVTQMMVRRLLFDHEVRRSFERLTTSELSQMNRIMDALGLPKDLRLVNISKLTRQQFLDQMSALERAYFQLADSIKDEEGRVYDANVLALGKDIASVEKIERGECIPLGWLEEDQQLKDSKCGIRAGMKNVVSESKKEVNELLRSQGHAPYY